MSEREPIKNRSEILLLYDVTNANPNGDPLDENKPRMDEATGINLVTDVRLKRFIRDYLQELIDNGDSRLAGQQIFVIEKLTEEGKVLTANQRAKEIDNNLNVETILQKCIDIRLFGGVIPSKGNRSITFTGPVQFKMGHSLHRVEPILIQGTGAFATEGKEQKTFREEWIVPYSFIAFYGVVNQNAARTTTMDDTDAELLWEALWNGVKESSISRSKFGHQPRLLLQVIYKEGENFYIGELDKLVKIVSDKDDLELRDVQDFVLDVTELVNKLAQVKDKIKQIRLRVDERLRTQYKGEEMSAAKALEKAGLKELLKEE